MDFSQSCIAHILPATPISPCLVFRLCWWHHGYHGRTCSQQFEDFLEKFHKTYDSAEEKELTKSWLPLTARPWKMVVAKLLFFPFSKGVYPPRNKRWKGSPCPWKMKLYETHPSRKGRFFPSCLLEEGFTHAKISWLESIAAGLEDTFPFPGMISRSQFSWFSTVIQ